VFAGTNDGIYRARLDELRFEKPPVYNFIPRVFDLLPDRSDTATILAGSHFGVLRSKDSGATWQVFSQGIPDHTIVECLASDPAKEAHLFAGTSAGLFESHDRGETWLPVADGKVGVNIPAIIYLDSAGRSLLAADNTFGGVLLSGDGGIHWRKIEDPEFSSPVRSLVQDPLHPSVIYLGTGTEGVYRLTLDGL